MTPAPAKVVSTRTRRSSNLGSGSSSPLGQGPGVDLRGQPGQVFLSGPGPGGGDQDLIGGGAAVSAGSLPVHRQMIRATDSDTTVPSARAARICG